MEDLIDLQQMDYHCCSSLSTKMYPSHYIYKSQSLLYGTQSLLYGTQSLLYGTGMIFFLSLFH